MPQILMSSGQMTINFIDWDYKMTQKLTLLRLEKEAAELERKPIENAHVKRVKTLDFHFCLYGLEDPYTGGYYHGVLELHQNYPFRAPKLLFFTPSGRFQVNTPICTSFTNFHQESWTSAWNVRTLILATISFMYSDEPSFGCRNDPPAFRRSLARQSAAFNLNNPQFVALFADKVQISPDRPICTELTDMRQHSGQLIRREGQQNLQQLEGHLRQMELGNVRGRRGRRQVVVLLLVMAILLIFFVSMV